MGGGTWSTTAYVSANTTRKASGTADFSYSADVHTGKAHGVHETLDPSKMTNGRREARDSDEHTNTIPIIILFDVTGSMMSIPGRLQKKLATVMDVIKVKAGLQDPQILVGAIGDTHSDAYPFQVGQFESDNRFDEQLRNIILEGGGGGGDSESYGLAWRFAAYHTETDAWDKRGKRGYLFTMGDEQPYRDITATEVESVFGAAAEGSESAKDLLEKAQKKWDVYHLLSMDGSKAGESIKNHWRGLLGQQLIQVEDSSQIAEIIAGIIHMMETSYDANRVVEDIGLVGDAAARVTTALAPLASTAVTSKAVGELPADHGA